MLMNNPEFKRNVWLELSTQRLILMPAVLGVIAALIIFLTQADDAEQTLLIAFSAIGLVLVGGWGSLAVANSINSEVAERTWDQQRLSVLSPWQMAWGKLLGASIYPWFGGFICAAVVLVCGLMQERPAQLITFMLTAILGCLALHCWLMASRLHTLDANAANNSSSTVKRLFGIFLLLQVGMPGIALFFASSRSKSSGTEGLWWGMQMPFSTLSLLIAALFLALGLLALWRTMCKQLMVRTTPWAWALGCVAVGFIFAGFVETDTTTAAHPWAAMVIATALTATYFALFSEKNNITVWRAVVFHARQQAWRRMLQTVPLWPVSLLLAVLFTLLYLMQGNRSTFASAEHTYTLLMHSSIWMAVLRTLRDAGIYLFFAWRNTIRKPAGMALLTYALLGVVLPLFFGSSPLAAFFEPLRGVQLEPTHLPGSSHAGILFSRAAWVGIFLQLAIVAGLLVWRWRKVTAANAEQKNA